MRLILFLLGLAFALNSCQRLVGESGFSSLTATYTFSDRTPLQCRSPVDPFYETKVLFVIDKTSSNKKLDPTAQKIQKLKSFVENNTEDVHYGILSYSKGKILNPINDYGVPMFTSDRLRVSQALLALEKADNAGGVNYSHLFNSIKKSLDYDVRMYKNTIIDYHILFLSGDSLKASKKEKDSFAYQLNKLRENSLINNLYIHSIYYGQNKTQLSMRDALGKGADMTLQIYSISQGFFFPTASIFSSPSKEDEAIEDNEHVKFLKSISSSGNGHYVDLNESSDWNFKWNKPWTVKNFFIYNMNASECLDGTTRLDSDQDGLCDIDELSMEGFDPHNRFSFNNGYSDAFQFLSFHKRNILPNCQDNTDLDHDLLTSCEEEYINSIESSLAPLQTNNPDSDGDGVIDGVEAILFLTTDLLAARNPNNIPQYSNDTTNVKTQLAAIKPENEQLKYKTEFIPIQEENSSCHALKQEEMPLYSLFVNENDTFGQISTDDDENVILVYFLREQQNSKNRIYQFKYEKAQINDSSTATPFYSLIHDDRLKNYFFQVQ